MLFEYFISNLLYAAKILFFNKMAKIISIVKKNLNKSKNLLVVLLSYKTI